MGYKANVLFSYFLTTSCLIFSFFRLIFSNKAKETKINLLISYLKFNSKIPFIP